MSDLGRRRTLPRPFAANPFSASPAARRARTAVSIARDLTELRADDVWLATFPKTGSSWLRTVWSALADGQAAPLAGLDRAVPALGAGTLAQRWTADVPRLVKTHLAYQPLLFARPQRAVLLVRDPRDALASLHHMLSRRRASRFRGSLSDLARDRRYGLAAYLRHYASWAPRATAVVRYEALTADAAGAVGALLEALGASVPAARVRAAVQQASQDRMRARAGLGDRFDADFAFVREGATRADAERFTADDEALYHRLRRAAGVDLYP